MNPEKHSFLEFTMLPTKTVSKILQDKLYKFKINSWCFNHCAQPKLFVDGGYWELN